MKGFLMVAGCLLSLGIVLFNKVQAVENSGVEPAAIFSDHMVLQRDKAINIWGTGAPGQTVEALLVLSDDYTVTSSATVNLEGFWLLSLPPQSAGGPYKLNIRSGNQTHTYSDVLIGDVWLASGQSNMEWKLHQQVDNWENEVADSNYPNIRFFDIDNHFSATEQSQIKSSDGWVRAHPNDSGSFSAVAWFFAKSLHLEKDIPVAVIDSTWGGTPAQAWTSLPVLSQQEHYKDMAIDLMENPQIWESEFAANEALVVEKYQLISSTSGYADGAVLSVDYDDSQWEARTVPNQQDEPFTDVAWLRKIVTFESAPHMATLHLGRLTQLGRVFVNGQQIYEQYWTDLNDQIEIPSGLLTQGENVIAVRLINDWDNKAYLGKENDVFLMADQQRISLVGSWKYSNNVEPPIPAVKRYNESPGVLFNAMINPLTQYPVKGVIWYQGESNVGEYPWYSELFKSMILDWRQQWNDSDLPFLFVQLASFLHPSEVPEESAWASLRDAQTSALALQNTGMAVALDIGDADDIHPRNKQAVGHRLYLAAKHVAYGESVVFSGPKISHVVKHTDKGRVGLRVYFSHSEGLRAMHADNLLGFAVAGEDAHYVNAKADILEDSVFVYAEQVLAPTRVRYGWANNSNGNLYNGAALPAVPFEESLD